MSLQNAVMQRLRTIFVCAVLECGVLLGVPMRPDELQKLLRQFNQPTVAHTLRDEDDEGDGARRPSRRGSGRRRMP